MRTYRKWPGKAHYVKSEVPDTSGVNVVQSQFVPIGNAYEIHPDAFMRGFIRGGLEDNTRTLMVNPADYHDLMRQLPLKTVHVRVGVFIKAVRRLNQVQGKE